MRNKSLVREYSQNTGPKTCYMASSGNLPLVEATPPTVTEDVRESGCGLRIVCFIVKNCLTKGRFLKRLRE